MSRTTDDETSAAKAFHAEVCPMLDKLPTYDSKLEALLNLVKSALIQEAKTQTNDGKDQFAAFAMLHVDFAMQLQDLVVSNLMGVCGCSRCRARRESGVNADIPGGLH